MCGLVGFIDQTRQGDTEYFYQIVQRMSETLKRRGPDDDGCWVDTDAGIALGHRRLSIIDLSPNGRQPMMSHDGRYILSYNGEVYNFRELRERLEAENVIFNGSSDTEVVVEACAHWGPYLAIERLNGMFAFALWDRKERQLLLARDHIGIKPIYWGNFGDLLIFGSELKALRAHPGWKPKIDRQALSSYLRHFYIPSPISIFEGIYKLPPGHILTWQFGKQPKIFCYWNIRDVAESGQRNPYDGTSRDALENLDLLLKDSIKHQMYSDVPLGAFLSGGIDSSAVVALMQSQSSRPVRTFSIGFSDQEFDEAPQARAIAAHLGTDHTEYYAEPKDAMDLIPKLHDYYDEPFADSSQLPTCLVSRMARQDVTVSLSGDGGDELFAGYRHYQTCSKIWRYLSMVPTPARTLAAHILCRLPISCAGVVGTMFPGEFGRQIKKGQSGRIGQLLRADGPDDLYRRVISQWIEPEQLVEGAIEFKGKIWDKTASTAISDFIARMQYYDAVQYLPDDILTKVDRASMAVSLETRLPLLDYRVFEFAWSLPMTMKLGAGGEKWILRELLSQYLPLAFFERPKRGFAVPIGNWLRGELREWAEDLLDEYRLRADGFFDPAPILIAWRAHISGQADFSYMIWTILMFQQWLHKTRI